MSRIHKRGDAQDRKPREEERRLQLSQENTKQSRPSRQVTKPTHSSSKKQQDSHKPSPKASNNTRPDRESTRQSQHTPRATRNQDVKQQSLEQSLLIRSISSLDKTHTKFIVVTCLLEGSFTNPSF